MDTHTAFRHAAKLEYALLRMPLHVVDERVVRRYLDEDSPVRQIFDRALGALDDAVEKLLREPGGDTAASDGRDEPEAEQQPKTEQASTKQPSTEAPKTARTRTAKSGTARPKAAAAAPAPQVIEDEAEQIEHLTEELLEEEKTETFAGELAEDDELRQVQAELQAKRLIEEQQEGH